jgi:ribosome recycling factor
MSSTFSENNYTVKMDKSIQSFKKDISTLRTGRANANMLDTIKVDVYGQLMPIDQLASVSVPEARLVSVQVWDKTNITLIDAAIQKSELGINPQVDGQIIRLRIPDLTEERRKDLIKILKNMGEKSKISIRSIRREANEELKKNLKDKIITEDEILSDKEKEILQI